MSHICIFCKGKLTNNLLKMLTGSMIEKFTKRFQDLKKVKQEPVYNLTEEQNYNQDQSKRSSKNVSEIQKNVSGSSNQQFQNQIDLQQNQQKQDKDILEPIPFQDEKKLLLQKIKNKIAGMNPNINQKNGQVNNNISEEKYQKKQKKSNKMRITRQVASNIEKTKKLKTQQIEQQSQNSQDSEQNVRQEKQENNNRRIVVAQILKQIKNMSNQQKNGYIRTKTKENKLLSTHELKIWIDAYDMIFNVQNQIKKLDQQPNEKIISKKFAQQFIKYVKRNINEKRYKFRRICTYALKQLNLTSQKVDTWLNRFVIQNSQHLKGLDFNQYKNPNQQNISKSKIIIEKQKNKQKKQENKSNSKIIKERIQFEDKQKQAEAKRLQKKFGKDGKKIKIKNQVEEVQQNIISSQQQQYESDQPKIKRKSKIIEQKKRQKQIIQKQKIKFRPKKQIKQQNQKDFEQEQKEQIINNQKQKILFIQSSKKVESNKLMNQISTKLRQNNIKNQSEIYKNHRTIENNIMKNQRQILYKNNKTIQNESFYSNQYPQSFKKKIASKLDLAFSTIIESLLKEKCQQFCLEEQALKQIYNDHGAYFLSKAHYSKNQKIQQLTENSYPQSQINKIIPEIKTNLNVKTEKKIPTLNLNTIYEQQKQKPKIQASKNIDRIQVQQPIINERKIIKTNGMHPQETQSIKQTIKQKPSFLSQQPKNEMSKSKIINPYQILAHKLNYFLRNNQGCPQHVIKEQAIRIVTTTPEIIGKVKQETLVRWINNFLQTHKEKINWNKNPKSQSNNSGNAPNQISYNGLSKANNESSQARFNIMPFSTSASSGMNHCQNNQMITKLAYQQMKPNANSQNGYENIKNFQISMPKANLNNSRVEPKNFMSSSLPKRI